MVSLEWFDSLTIAECNWVCNYDLGKEQQKFIHVLRHRQQSGEPFDCVKLSYEEKCRGRRTSAKYFSVSQISKSCYEIPLHRCALFQVKHTYRKNYRNAWNVPSSKATRKYRIPSDLLLQFCCYDMSNAHHISKNNKHRSHNINVDT